MTLPPLPTHPDHNFLWSPMESDAIRAYGLACRKQALEEAKKACRGVGPLECETGNYPSHEPTIQACLCAIRQLGEQT